MYGCAVQCGVMLALPLAPFCAGLGTTVLFCLFARPWLFLWLGQEHFSLLLCSSPPSSLLDCSEIPSLSSSFAFFQDVFSLGMHSAMCLSWIHLMDIYLDAQTMGMSLTYRGGKRPLRSSDPSISSSIHFIDNNNDKIIIRYIT